MQTQETAPYLSHQLLACFILISERRRKVLNTNVIFKADTILYLEDLDAMKVTEQLD